MPVRLAIAAATAAGIEDLWDMTGPAELGPPAIPLDAPDASLSSNARCACFRFLYLKASMIRRRKNAAPATPPTTPPTICFSRGVRASSFVSEPAVGCA